MDNGWQRVKLEDVCLVITDGAHLSPPSVDKDGFPMASVKDLTPYGVNLKSSRLISEKDYKILVRQGCKPIKGDVLIAKDGASALDTVCYLKNDLEAVLLSSVAILRPDPNKIDGIFLRYYLDSSTVRQYMKNSFISGAAIPRVVLKDFKRVNIIFPSISVQKRIAHILSGYDDLIENNTKRIKTLEKMAQLIYKEWFINFRFPGYEKVKMTDSPLGEIPEGWEIGKLKDIAEIIPGYAFKSSDWKDNGIPVIKIKNITPDNNINLKDIDYISKELITPKLDKYRLIMGDYLIAMTGATAGKVGRLRAEKEVYLNQRVAKIKPHSIFNCYVSTLISNKETQKRFYDLADGAAQPNMSGDQIGSINLIIPSEDIAILFNDLTKQFYKLSDSLYLKNVLLRQARDLLLPKLMNGKVELNG